MPQPANASALTRARAPAGTQVLLETNTAGNLQLVVQVAKEYTEQLGAGKIMELLEGHKSYHGLYYYLGGHIAFSEDPEVGGPRPACAASRHPGRSWLSRYRLLRSGSRLERLPAAL